MFVHIVVPREDLERSGGVGAEAMGFVGAYYMNAHWPGEPEIVRREPAISFHTHWHEDILRHPFTADRAAFLRIEEPGEYGSELVTSGPTVLSFDQKPIFETETFDDPAPRRVTVPASRGEHLLVVSYWEKSSLATIALSGQLPSRKTEVIPIGVLRPLSGGICARARQPLSGEQWELRVSLIARGAAGGQAGPPDRTQTQHHQTDRWRFPWGG